MPLRAQRDITSHFRWWEVERWCIMWMARSQADSVFNYQFTTNDQTFAPNQTIDQAFYVLASVNLEQLKAPYRLDSVSVIPGSNNPNLDPNILRLSRRTNNASAAIPAQNIYDLHYTDSITNYTDSVQGFRI